VHHHTIQINHQLDATISPVYYPDVYLQLNMFWASSRPSSGAQQLRSSLWFYLRIVVIAVLLVVVRPAGPTTTNITAIITLQR